MSAALGKALDALTWMSRDLSRRGYPYAELPRNVARVLVAAELEERPGCAQCGEELPAVGPRGGRPRRYCEKCSPPRSENPGKPPTVETITAMSKQSCECECRVVIGDGRGGLSFEYVESEGVEIAPDWAGRPSVSVADARRLSEKARQRHDEHEVAWDKFQRDRKQWVRDRTAAVGEAYRAAREDARRRGPGEASTKAREAAQEAGERYERETPRPVFGDLPPSSTVALEYLTEDDLAPASARLLRAVRGSQEVA